MDITKITEALAQLDKIEKNDVNKQDAIIFEDLKMNLANVSPVILKNKILALRYFYDGGDLEYSYDTIPPEEKSYYDISRLILFYKERLFELETPKNNEDLYKKKLLKAKNNNINFYENLGEMIVGDTEFFPYRSSMFISRFFEESGYPNLKHDGSTRRLWVARQLEAMTIDDLYNVIKCLFRKKYFIEASKIKDGKTVDIEKAKLQLKELISQSCQEDEFEDLRDVFDLNINASLLFNQKIVTNDDTFNSDLETARKFYIDNNLQLAIEKIWDAFERIKSSFHSDKKTSIEIIVHKLSDEITNSVASPCETKDLFFNKELYELTQIGNNYKIRHSELGKKELSNNATMEYLFFKVLNLINLIHIRMRQN